MGFIENTVGNLLGWLANFLVHSLVPWAWDHRLWFIALIPIAGLLAIAKWIRG